jgi:hypothetical protein
MYFVRPENNRKVEKFPKLENSFGYKEAEVSFVELCLSTYKNSMAS